LVTIKNKLSIINNGQTEKCREARKTALIILETALLAVDPKNLIKTKLKVTQDIIQISDLKFQLQDFDRIFVLGGGKASGAMAEGVWEILGPKISGGVINVLKGTAENFSTGRIALNEARHPIPNEDGVKGVTKMLEVLDGITEKDLVIFLISGGGSALMPMPQKGITLEEMQNVTTSLLKSGAYIDEINIVRKHLSQIKGGRMVLHVHPATLLSFVLSDVVGDSLTSIASGPTVPDPTTFADAINVLKRYSIWQSAPESVKRCLSDGVEGRLRESLKPGDLKLKKVQNLILGSNRVALQAALEKASCLGFNSMILSTFIEGEARHIGTAIAGIAREIMASGLPLECPAVLLCGGETTVTVKGDGLGGRNQELALSSALRLRGLEGVVVASIGTDGIDGPTNAAGAVVDGSTWNRSRDKGLNLELSLNDNDSYTLFNQLGDLIITGPTGTNVNDIMIIVVNS